MCNDPLVVTHDGGEVKRHLVAPMAREEVEHGLGVEVVLESASFISSDQKLSSRKSTHLVGAQKLPHVVLHEPLFGLDVLDVVRRALGSRDVLEIGRAHV